MADKVSSDITTPDSGITTFSSTPDMSGMMKSMAVTPVTRDYAPANLIPQGAKTVIVTEVKEDGSLGNYSKTFPKYLLNFNVTGTRETEELETGEGADEERPISESYDVEMEVNAYNALFHAMIAGQEVTIGAIPVRQMGDILITKGGTDPDFTYSYTFSAGVEPVEQNTGKGDYGIVLSDAKGHELQSVATKAEVALGLYHYDAATKTISVSVEYENESLAIIYFVLGAASTMKVSASDIIKSTVFKIECLSVMASASTGARFMKRQVISRCQLSGDAPEPPTQKDINQNMTYSLSSVTPGIGEKPYEVTISPYVEL